MSIHINKRTAEGGTLPGLPSGCRFLSGVPRLVLRGYTATGETPVSIAEIERRILAGESLSDLEAELDLLDNQLTKKGF